MQIKIDDDFSPGCANGYVEQNLFYVIPVIVLNSEALKQSPVTTALHETGHLADTIPTDFQEIIPLGLLWVVEPATKKITEWVCEPILEKAISTTKKLVEHTIENPHKNSTYQAISSTLPVVKKLTKFGCYVGLIFVSGLGLEALSAYLARKHEEFADDFACKHTKNPFALLLNAKNYYINALVDRASEQKTHPIKSFLDSCFVRHPSNDSRMKKFVSQSIKRIKESPKSLIQPGIDLVKKYIKWPGKGK